MSDTTKVELEQKLHEAETEYNRVHNERVALLRQAHELDNQEREAHATWWAMREALTHLGHKVELSNIVRHDELGELGDSDELACDLARHALRIVSDLVGPVGSSPVPGWELRRRRDGMTTRGW